MLRQRSRQVLQPGRAVQPQLFHQQRGGANLETVVKRYVEGLERPE